MKNIIWIGIVVVAVIVIIVGFLLSSGIPTIETEETLQSETITPTAEVKEFIVEGSEFEFNPVSITVNRGDAVKIIFKNIGGTIHNLVISELGVSTKTIQPGKTDTIEFIADKSGTFSFYCSISGHRSAGMEGNLKVT